MDKVYAELLDRRDLLLINIENGERNISKEYIERHLERARPVHWRACLREAQERHGDGSAVQLAALTANPFNAELLEKGDRVFAIAALLAELQALQDLYRAVTKITDFPRHQGASSLPRATQARPLHPPPQVAVASQLLQAHPPLASQSLFGADVYATRTTAAPPSWHPLHQAATQAAPPLALRGDDGAQVADASRWASEALTWD